MTAIIRTLLGKNPLEPVLGRASVAAAVALLVAFGVDLSTDQADALVDVLTYVLPALAALVPAWLARGKVTPLAEPKADDGTPLVPLDGLGA